MQHEAGYICAMLFIIPGFPFITSGIDLAKLDMRSGVERFTYALIVVLVATMSAWIMALILHLQPVDLKNVIATGSVDSVSASGEFLWSVWFLCYV